jgi:predicted Fe-Mo cluster-binding NifX family protein
MRFAISTDGENVSPHFGRCLLFTIVDIEDNKVIKKEVLENPGHHPGYLPKYFYQLNIDGIVCGGIGQRAIQLFENFNIKIFSGVDGKIVDVVEKLVKEELKCGESSCVPGAGKNYGLNKTECDHNNT